MYRSMIALEMIVSSSDIWSPPCFGGARRRGGQQETWRFWIQLPYGGMTRIRFKGLSCQGSPLSRVPCRGTPSPRSARSLSRSTRPFDHAERDAEDTRKLAH